MLRMSTRPKENLQLRQKWELYDNAVSIVDTKRLEGIS